MVVGSNPAARPGWDADGAAPRRPLGFARRKAAYLLACLAAGLAVSTAPAAAQSVQITKLSDVGFGTVVDFTTDAVSPQSVCVYSSTAQGAYNVRAQGSGTANAFTLLNGAAPLAYEVQWSDKSGRSTGTSLTPNTTLTGLRSNANNATCSSGPATTASLIVLIRGTSLGSAAGGTYNGTLTLIVAPE